jgi:hypothetical protein
LLRSAPDYGILLKTVRVASFLAHLSGVLIDDVMAVLLPIFDSFSASCQRNHGFLLTNKAQASSHSLLIFRDE